MLDIMLAARVKKLEMAIDHAIQYRIMQLAQSCPNCKGSSCPHGSELDTMLIMLKEGLRR